MLVHEKRFFASIIDIGIVLFITLLIDIFIPSGIFDGTFVFLLIYFVVNFIYMSLCLFISKDRTIGLYAMSIRLLARDWGKISKKVIFIRAISHGVIALYLVNILYMLLNKTESTLFDELSDSFIIKTGDDYGVEDSNNINDK